MKQLFLAALLLTLSICPAVAVGLQWGAAPDGDKAPLQIAIWYPSESATLSQVVGPFDIDVALNGGVSRGKYKLIVMSHGTGGMALNSFDTAIALAEAGFVVVSLTHTGDNYRDQSTAFIAQNFVDRPRHISRVIDFMLTSWPARDSIDPSGIGVLGHSAGGTTALIAAGGVADMMQVVAFCRTNPDDWSCQRSRESGPVAAGTALAPISEPDPRIRAVVVAAPAIAAVFEPAGLAAVKQPVQLWVGAEDAIVRNASLVRALLPTPPDYHLVTGGGHFAFLAPCSAILETTAPQLCVDPPGFDRAAFLRTFQQSVAAFYRESLK
jgi:predicted dienelactone hydrolase